MDNDVRQTSAGDREQPVRQDFDPAERRTNQEQVRDVEFGSGWYHEAAIRESGKVVPQKH